jgi:hypothetical protein
LNFTPQPLDPLDQACREHDFHYAHGMQKTGDLLLLHAISCLEDQKSKATAVVFTVKKLFSVDRLRKNFCVGAEDLYARYPYPRGQHDSIAFLQIPVPPTLRDWLVVEISNLHKFVV